MGAPAAVDYDAQQMLRVRRGDGECFGALLRKYRGPVVHFLYRMVQNQPVAEELAQEVFLRVYRSREAYEPAAKFTTWLFRIATHTALNWLRDKRNERLQESLDVPSGEAHALQVSDGRLSAEQVMVREAQLEEVRRAVAALPAKQRAAVLMHKYEGMAYAQIAVALDCSESAVKSLLFRAYETLRERLAHMAE
jgi:RNA polymerase sigma-70 factor, ECF subfamily